MDGSLLENKMLLALVLGMLSSREQHRVMQVARLWNYVLRTYVVHKVVSIREYHPHMHERALGFARLGDLRLHGYYRCATRRFA